MIKLEIAEKLRFSEDNPLAHGLQQFKASGVHARQIRQELLENTVQVSPELFPSISQAASAAVSALRMPEKPKFFVHSNPHVQAMCAYLGDDHPCAVILYSGLIELLTMHELQFVIGHELGHHLLGHHEFMAHDGDNYSGLKQLAYLQWRRAAEISADRFGFVCTTTDKSAVSAILKTASGLSDKHLRLDALAYQKQAKQILQSRNATGLQHTHPTLPVRARALHWFAMSEAYYACRDFGNKAALTTRKVDATISKELASAILPGGISKNSSALCYRAMMWTLLVFFYSDNVLSIAEKKVLQQYASEQSVTKAIRFVREHGVEAVREKQNNAVEALRTISIADRKEFVKNIRSALQDSSDAHEDVLVFVKELERKIGI